MAELLSKQPLFNGKTEFDQVYKIFKTLGTPNETIWPGYSKLPGVKRITAEATLNHEWFREVPLPKSKDFMPTFPAQHAHDSPSPGPNNPVRMLVVLCGKGFTLPNHRSDGWLRGFEVCGLDLLLQTVGLHEALLIHSGYTSFVMPWMGLVRG
ncbi:hypothetical protein R6Q57_022778 [Mikania cordata]